MKNPSAYPHRHGLGESPLSDYELIIVRAPNHSRPRVGNAPRGNQGCADVGSELETNDVSTYREADASARQPIVMQPGLLESAYNPRALREHSRPRWFAADASASTSRWRKASLDGDSPAHHFDRKT